MESLHRRKAINAQRLVEAEAQRQMNFAKYFPGLYPRLTFPELGKTLVPLAEIERQYLIKVLAEVRFKQDAAKVLAIDRRTLRRMQTRHGLLETLSV